VQFILYNQNEIIRIS